MRVDGQVRMTLAEHLGELRLRLLRSIGILLATVVLSMAFYRTWVDLATAPHFRAMSWCGLSHEQAKLLLNTHTGAVMAIMKLVLVAAVFVASPLIAREAWGFVAAGLHRHERRWVLRFAPASLGLFLLGCAFGYFVLIPWTLYGMAQLMPLDQIRLVVDFREYVGLVVTLTVLLGAVFQVPLVMAFLSAIGVVPASSWARWRRGAIVANVALAAVLSPPDLLGMLAFAAPLLLLYEVGVRISGLAARGSSGP
jgi:sec-independent protein translocase protein TatC